MDGVRGAFFVLSYFVRSRAPMSVNSHRFIGAFRAFFQRTSLAANALQDARNFRSVREVAGSFRVRHGHVRHGFNLHHVVSELDARKTTDPSRQPLESQPRGSEQAKLAAPSNGNGHSAPRKGSRTPRGTARAALAGC